MSRENQLDSSSHANENVRYVDRVPERSPCRHFRIGQLLVQRAFGCAFFQLGTMDLSIVFTWVASMGHIITGTVQSWVVVVDHANGEEEANAASDERIQAAIDVVIAEGGGFREHVRVTEDAENELLQHAEEDDELEKDEFAPDGWFGRREFFAVPPKKWKHAPDCNAQGDRVQDRDDKVYHLMLIASSTLNCVDDDFGPK